MPLVMDGSRLQYWRHDNLMEPLHRQGDGGHDCQLFGAVARPTERLGGVVVPLATRLITPTECVGMVIVPWCGVGLRVASPSQTKQIVNGHRHFPGGRRADRSL